jgi:hypothetical protein
MGFAYTFANTEGVYFVTFTVVEWVDIFTPLARECRQAMCACVLVPSVLLNFIFITKI